MSLNFQLNFSDAVWISPQIEQDRLFMKVKKPDMFRAAETNRKIDNPSFVSEVKKQMPNSDTSRNFDVSTATASSIMGNSTFILFLLNLVVGGGIL